MILKAYKKVLFSAINCRELYKKKPSLITFLKRKRVSFVCLNIILMYTAHALQNIQFGSSVHTEFTIGGMKLINNFHGQS